MIRIGEKKGLGKWSVIMTFLLLLAGCAVEGEEKLLITVSPDGLVITGEITTQQFSQDQSGITVQWSIDPAGQGSIDSNGVYTPPNDLLASPDKITVIATDSSSGTSGEATVYLTPFKANKRLTTHYTAGSAEADTYSSGQRGIALFQDPKTGAISIYTVWADNSSNGIFQVFFTMSPDGGDNFCTPIAISPGGWTQRSPSVAVDSNGKVYVVWEDNRDGDFDIYISEYDGASCDTTLEWNTSLFSSPPTKVNKTRDLLSGSVIDDTTPAMAIDPDDNVYVVWEDRLESTSENYPDIYMATSSDSFALSVKIADHGRHPAISIDSAGNVFVTWEDLSGFPSQNPTHIKLCKATMNTGCADTIILTTSSDQHRHPSISIGPEGYIYATWARASIESPGFDNEIIRSYDLDIAVLEWTADRFTSKYEETSFPDTSPGLYGGRAYPTIGGDSNYIYIAWEDQRNGAFSRGIYYARGVWDSINGKIAFTTNHIVNDYPGMSREKPAITGLNGKAYVIWTDYRNAPSDPSLSSSGEKLSDVYFSVQK